MKVANKVKSAVRPFAEFTESQTASSLLLLSCTLAALIWANSPWAPSYHHFFGLDVGVLYGEQHFSLTVEEWISDGLMALFFFYLGLEIKREFLVGELRHLDRSLPIIMAAIGGMLCPAAIYLILNPPDSEFSHGWGIPMATDTAFALGILALLGRRAPMGAALFITALAIIDDIGAMLVIAIAYTEELHCQPLAYSGVILMVLAAGNWFGIRHSALYAIGGCIVWGLLHEAGIHTTLAGILVAITVPARPRIGRTGFLAKSSTLLRHAFALRRDRQDSGVLEDEEQHEVIEGVRQEAERATTPLRRWENLFSKPITLLVMPLFALANAGIPLSGQLFAELLQQPLAWGIAAGLALGKMGGILLFSFLTMKIAGGKLPSGLRLNDVVGIGFLAGIGFTMSILVATLAFTGSQESAFAPADLSKITILLTSLCCGLLGYLWLRVTSTENKANIQDGR